MRFQAFAAGLAGLALSWLVLPASSAASVRVVSRSDPSLPHQTGARFSFLHDFGRPITADGRYVAFSGWAPDLVPGVYLPGYEVFLFDRQNLVTTLVSRSALDPTRGALGGQSAQAVVAGDGSKVAFASDAPDLISGYSGSGLQVYLWDRATGTVRLVSHDHASATTGSDQGGTPVAVSSDGRFLVFLSSSGDLFPGVVATGSQIYLYDAQLDVLTLASPAAGSTVQGSDASAQDVHISADAEWITFDSGATDLVPGYSGAGFQIYLFRRSTGEVRLVSHAAGLPAQGCNAYSRDPAISADGSRLAFTSLATDLVSEDPRGSAQIYGYDIGSDSLALVTLSQTVPASGGDGGSGEARLSADGRYLVLATAAKDLLDQPLPQDATIQVLLFDRTTGDRQLVSHGYADPGLPSLGSMSAPRISDDASTVVFESTATDLVPGYSGGYWSQLYSWSRTGGEIRLLTPAVGTTATGSDEDAGRGANLVADGSLVVFTSKADDLVAGDWNRAWDVFAAATDGSGLEAVSRHDPLAPISSTAGGTSRLMGSRGVLSDDGKVVLFTSYAPDLVAGDTYDGASHPFFYDAETDRVAEILPPGATQREPGAGTLPAGSVSADGATILFEAWTPTVGNEYVQTFLLDRSQSLTRLVSHRFDSPDVGAAADSSLAELSRGGLVALFHSSADDLVAGYSGTGTQIFLFDRTTGDNRLVSHAAGAPTTAANGGSVATGVSFDGRWTLFYSWATDLVAGYTGSNEQIYLFDAADNSVHLVSHAAGLPTQAGNGGSGSAVLSRDGRYVAFQSWARDLVDPPLPAPNGAQLFLWDRTIDSTRLVSHAALDPTEISDGRNSRPAISADGGYLAWTSDSTNLVEGFHGGYQYVYQVYLWSRDLDATMLASHADGDPTQAAGYGAAGDPSICSDGSRIAFVSDSYDLLPYGEYGRLDTYVFDRTSGSLRRVSQASADGGDFYPQSEIRSQISADGRVTAFESDSWYVTPRDWNMALDVFLQGDGLGDAIFADGFESGDTSAWSATGGG